MPTLPTSLALINIPDGSPIVASDHRSNYNSVQVAVNALVAILDNGAGIDGDPLVWDNTLSKWTAASRLAAGRPRAPRVVSSTMAGGPPASPIDGDIWIATAVDANGTVWQFRYNAGSASAYKWEFIGGPPATVNIATYEGTGTIGAYTDLTTLGPSVTVARGGDYVAQATSAPTIGAGATTIFMGIAVMPAAPVPAVAFAGAPAAAGTLAVGSKFLALAAATELRVRYYAQQASDRWALRVLTVTPVRIA